MTIKYKKHIILISILILAGLLTAYIIIHIKFNGSTVESRELRLREIPNYGKNTMITEEIEVNDRIVSGFTYKENQLGLAIFCPTGNNNYDFCRTIKSDDINTIFSSTTINSKPYELFWANNSNLDYIEVTYTIDGNPCKTEKVDAKDNSIVYIESPSNDYSVEYSFADLDGNITSSEY